MFQVLALSCLILLVKRTYGTIQKKTVKKTLKRTLMVKFKEGKLMKCDIDEGRGEKEDEEDSLLDNA